MSGVEASHKAENFSYKGHPHLNQCSQMAFLVGALQMAAMIMLAWELAFQKNLLRKVDKKYILLGDKTACLYTDFNETFAATRVHSQY